MENEIKINRMNLKPLLDDMKSENSGLKVKELGTKISSRTDSFNEFFAIYKEFIKMVEDYTIVFAQDLDVVYDDLEKFQYSDIFWTPYSSSTLPRTSDNKGGK